MPSTPTRWLAALRLPAASTCPASGSARRGSAPGRAPCHRRGHGRHGAGFASRTCGGAILLRQRRRGRLDGALQPQSRGKRDSTLPLQAGAERDPIWFDDLAERDARYFFQLDYLDGPAASVAVPMPVEGERRRAIEAALEGMHFEQAGLCRRRGRAASRDAPLPVGRRRQCRGRGRLHVDRDASTIDCRLKAGRRASGDRPSPKTLPADFRHFRVTLTAGGFVAARSLGVEICHADRQGTAPAALADRDRRGARRSRRACRARHGARACAARARPRRPPTPTR